MIVIVIMTITYLCQCFQFCRERPVQETLSPLSPSNMAKIIIMLINCDHDDYYSSTRNRMFFKQLYTMLMIIAIQDHNDDKDEDYNDDVPTVSSPC